MYKKRSKSRVMRKRADVISRRTLLGLGLSLVGMSFLRNAGYAATWRRSTADVEIENGKLRGRIVEGIASFKGIPYGAPTGGSRRFLIPAAAPSWARVREAYSYGPQCPQVNPDYPAWVDASAATEDCLALNVWVPEGKVGSESRLPVMVWIHGGAYVFGSGTAPLYDGHSLSKASGHVVVSINHRLNIFGYTYFGGDADERFADAGNVGQLDLVAALRWIRTNISRFGGDSGNVTLFGESGGGGKVSSLCAMPAAAGLFHKAIVQSGSSPQPLDPEFAGRLTHQVFQTFGLRQGDIKALQSLSAETLTKGYSQILQAPLPGSFPLLMWGPVGDGRALARDAWNQVAPVTARKVPMIIGTNNQEAATFIDRLSDPIANDAELADRIERSTVVLGVPHQRLPQLIADYRRAFPKLGESELLVRIATDCGFWISAVREAELKALDRGAPVFMYECAWRTPCHGGMWAMHGVEIPFVFGVHKYASAWDGKDNDAARDAADPANDRRRVGAQMLAAWAAFASSGNPSTEALRWPAYDLDRRSTMVFDRRSQPVEDPRSSVRAAVIAL